MEANGRSDGRRQTRKSARDGKWSCRVRAGTSRVSARYWQGGRKRMVRVRRVEDHLDLPEEVSDCPLTQGHGVREVGDTSSQASSWPVESRWRQMRDQSALSAEGEPKRGWPHMTAPLQCSLAWSSAMRARSWVSKSMPTVSPGLRLMAKPIPSFSSIQENSTTRPPP